MSESSVLRGTEGDEGMSRFSRRVATGACFAATLALAAAACLWIHTDDPPGSARGPRQASAHPAGAPMPEREPPAASGASAELRPDTQAPPHAVPSEPAQHANGGADAPGWLDQDGGWKYGWQLNISLPLAMRFGGKLLTQETFPDDSDVLGNTLLAGRPGSTLRLLFWPPPAELEAIRLSLREQAIEDWSNRSYHAEPEDQLMPPEKDPANWPPEQILWEADLCFEFYSVDYPDPSDERSPASAPASPDLMMAKVSIHPSNCHESLARWLVAHFARRSTTALGHWQLAALDRNSDHHSSFLTFRNIEKLRPLAAPTSAASQDGEQWWCAMEFSRVDIELSRGSGNAVWCLTGRLGRGSDGKGVQTSGFCISVTDTRPEPAAAGDSEGDADRHGLESEVNLTLWMCSGPTGDFCWWPESDAAKWISNRISPDPGRLRWALHLDSPWDSDDALLPGVALPQPDIRGNRIELGRITYPGTTVELSVPIGADQWPLGYPGMGKRFGLGLELRDGEDRVDDWETTTKAASIPRVLGFPGSASRAEAEATLADSDLYRLSGSAEFSVAMPGNEFRILLKPQWSNTRRVTVSADSHPAAGAVFRVFGVRRECREYDSEDAPAAGGLPDEVTHVLDDWSVRSQGRWNGRVVEAPGFLPTHGSASELEGHWIVAAAPGWAPVAHFAPASGLADIEVALTEPIPLLEIRVGAGPLGSDHSPRIRDKLGDSPPQIHYRLSLVTEQPGGHSSSSLMGHFTTSLDRPAFSVEARLGPASHLCIEPMGSAGHGIEAAWPPGTAITVPIPHASQGTISLPAIKIPQPALYYLTGSQHVHGCWLPADDEWPQPHWTTRIVVGDRQVSARLQLCDGSGSVVQGDERPRAVRDGSGVLPVEAIQAGHTSVVRLAPRVTVDVKLPEGAHGRHALSLTNPGQRSGTALTISESGSYELWCPVGAARLVLWDTSPAEPLVVREVPVNVTGGNLSLSIVVENKPDR